MITVHHLDHSRSQRILWLLEELGLPYQIQRYQRDPVTLLAPPELKRVHPLGKSPVLVDDGRALAESAAILEYLAARNGGRLRPAAATEDGLRCTYFLHYAEGSLMPPLLVGLITGRLGQAPVPWPLRPFGKLLAEGVRRKFVAPNFRAHFDFVESELAARPWFAGEELTIADIQMSYPLENIVARGLAGERKHIRAFVERIRARPAYQRAERAGGPVTF